MDDIVINTAMEKLLHKKFFWRNKVETQRILSIISHDMSKLIYRMEGNQYWLAMDNRKLTIEDIEHAYGDLVAYEWSCNEIYIEPEFIKNNFREAIPFAFQAVKETLIKKYPKEKFFIALSAQKGQYANISIHFHLYRENVFYLDLDIENYTQPTLYKIIDPSM